MGKKFALRFLTVNEVSTVRRQKVENFTAGNYDLNQRCTVQSLVADFLISELWKVDVMLPLREINLLVRDKIFTVT